MRTHLFRPTGTDKYPAVILFSEIYQMTGPIARTAAFVAGNGFLVAVPEVYHEFTSINVALASAKMTTRSTACLKYKRR